MENKLQTLFVGIDIHKETHTLAGANVACDRLCELTFKNNLEGFRKALEKVDETAREKKLTPLLGLEDTGGNGLALARFLSSQSVPIKTVSPVLVDRLRKHNTHPEKSDIQDAQCIAEVLIRRTDQLPDFTLTPRSEFAKDLSTLVKDREDLVFQQTKLKNKLHRALQESWTIAYRGICQKAIFGKRALEFWKRYPTAADFKRTTKPMKPKPDWILNSTLEELPSVSRIQKEHILRLLSLLETVMKQMKEIETQLSALIKEEYSYLLTLPGCGLVVASQLAAYIRDIGWFPSESQLAKYCGIAPRKCESGEARRDIQSMRGHGALRRAFKSLALSQIGRRGNQKAKEYFRKKISEGKTKKQALKCLMRQNVRIVFKMMKEQRPYY